MISEGFVERSEQLVVIEAGVGSLDLFDVK